MRAAGFAARALLLTVALVLAPLLFLRSAHAGETETRARAEAILVRAEHDDEALAFARALAGYDEGRALDPGSPRSPRAEARGATLRSHAEGGFAPFAELERLRRDPALSSDVRAVDTLVQHAESFPPGLVRVEVWVLAAEAYAHRFARPLDADALLGRVLVDPQVDRIMAQKAARDLVGLRVARQDLAGAQDAVRLAGAHADPLLGRDVRRLVRRRFVHFAAIGAVVAMIALALFSGVNATRRGRARQVGASLARTWKLAAGYAAYVALGGAALAVGYQEGTGKPFLWFGVVLLPVLLLARAWSAAGSSTRTARLGRACLSAGGALGAAFLVLEAIDVQFLEGMGL